LTGSYRAVTLKDMMPLKFPVILGRDIAGEIVGLGEGVAGLNLGERVLGMVNHAYAEYVVCKADDLARIPDTLQSVDAAALPLVVLTGAQLIENGVRPHSGQTLLITGAMGGVGRTAVHVAKRHAVRVIAGVRTNQQSEAERLGADRVVALDDDKAIDRLKELDAVADTVGQDVIGRLIPHIRKGGILATVVGKPGSAVGHDIRVEEVRVRPDSKRLAQLAQEVAQGAFTIPVGKRLKLSEIRYGHQLAEKGGIGKVVLTP
jgi:NADPH:quinone reductase-like Zn-dependent oxidoreductase